MRLFAALLLFAAVAVAVSSLLRDPDAAAPSVPADVATEEVLEPEQELVGPVESAGRVAGAAASEEDEGGDTTGTLEVLVLDAEGQGVFGAHVYARAAEGHEIDGAPNLRTDPDGEGELQVPAGVPLVVSAAKFGDTTQASQDVDSLAPGEVRELVLEVQRASDLAADVTVEVRDPSGAPISGARLYVGRQEGFGRRGAPRPFAPPGEPDAVSGSDGTAVISTEPLATTYASVLAAGRAPRLVFLRGPEPGPPSGDAIVVVLGVGARAEGRVVGAPEGAVARAVCAPYELQESGGVNPVFGADRSFEGPIQPDGTFVIDPVPVGARLRFELVDGREVLLQDPEPVNLAAGDVHRLEWVVGAGVSLRCIVREESGEPAEGVGVWLLTSDVGRPGLAEFYWSPTAERTSGADGRATFEDVRPGRWIVALEPRRHGARAPDAYPPTSIAVDVDADGGDAVLELVRGLYVSGQVVGPEGSGQQASVLFHSPGGFLSESTEPDGAFVLGPLPAGRATLTARTFARGEAALAPSEPVEVEPGEEGLVLRLRPGASATVRATAAGVACNARFSAAKVGEEFGWRGTGGNSDEGTFGGLELGSYVFTAVTADGRVGEFGPVTLAASEEREIEIPVTPGGTVRIHYEGEHPHLQCAVLRHGAQLSAGTAISGGDEVFTVPSGRATVRMIVFDRAQTPATRVYEELREVDVVAGEEVRIDVEQ